MYFLLFPGIPDLQINAHRAAGTPWIPVNVSQQEHHFGFDAVTNGSVIVFCVLSGVNVRFVFQTGDGTCSSHVVCTPAKTRRSYLEGLFVLGSRRLE